MEIVADLVSAILACQLPKGEKHMSSILSALSPTPACFCTMFKCQARQRLLDLSFSILERFGLGADAPGGGGSSSVASAALAACTPSGLGSSKAVAGNGFVGGGSGAAAKRPGSAAEEVATGPGVLAATTVEYQAFAPLVVSTLKVSGLFVYRISRIHVVLATCILFGVGRV